jgi:hypothetical protein
MAIHSKNLETLEAVIATALNIVKNRPLGTNRLVALSSRPDSSSSALT